MHQKSLDNKEDLSYKLTSLYAARGNRII